MSQALADLLIVNLKKKKKSYQHITRHIVNIGSTNYYMIKQTNNCKDLYDKPQQRNIMAEPLPENPFHIVYFQPTAHTK